ncbi:insulinase family protein [Marinobacter salarius]|jgi:secreted Zn-dependent insulinase-like peptidase|uniref:insulinase family protein n=1 Tax=Marinobacter salarius TaxID=1420917 RepID=UPI001D1840A7|nr:insulinase family protein [Marinobacter salarius]MCC4285741.1 insulinase family protein [Marinobacter salarius]
MHPGIHGFAQGFLGLKQGFLLALVLAFSSVALASQSPTKSPNDANLYRYVQLDNQLRVLLISAPGSDKAAASMNVAVGSGDDPANREGLSHFLEHMLFLGTEKYPDPGEYQQFIKSHGGSHNAFTAFQDTNYFFDVQAEHLKEALDRFAEQFSAPLFTPELVDRERRAVHSEYSSKQKDDSRRFYSVKKAVSNPDHAFHQFAVGNLTTLENTEERPLRPDLIDFWKAHYSSNLMTLAVYGPQSLDQLEAMVRGRFDRIENRNLNAKVHDEPLFSPGTLPARVHADALKDIRNLTLTFPIPSQEDHYRDKPANYVASLLGHEGPGSLFDVLKKAGLVESLSAGSGMDTGQEATLELNMALTPEGLENQETILELTFAYIDKVREEGISRTRFEEMKQLAQIDFRFREKSQPVQEVMHLSRQMRHVAPEDVLQAPWMMESYAPDKYRNILNRLTPDNVLVSVLETEPNLEDPNLTQWYDAAWKLKPLAIRDIRQRDDNPMVSRLALPLDNPFIPEELDMIDGATMEQPVSMGTVSGMEVWYARDTRFETPKANVYLSLRTPATRASARSNVLSSLLVDAINTNVNAWAYPAQLAGLDYSIYPHLRGITVRVGGYSDKLHTLMARILTQVADPTLTEQRFRIARQNMIDGLLNKAKERPVQQTSERIQSLLIEGAWSTEEKLKAAREVTLDELKSFSEAFLAQVDPVMLAHGNMTQASALNLTNRIHAMVLDDSELTTVERSRVRALPEGETVLPLEVDHPDTGYSLYVQGDNTSFEERAVFRLLGQIISSPFYEELRTNRQLGYIVYATPFEMLETPALGFVVQSPEANGDQIDQAVREFSKVFKDTLSNLSEQDLAREKQAVISQLMEQDRQLGEISERYWREIDRGATDFKSREKLAKAIQSVSREALVNTLQKQVIDRKQALQVFTTAEAKNNASVVELLLQRSAVPDA